MRLTRAGARACRWLWLPVLALSASVVSLAETRVADSVVIAQAIDDDLYAAGGEVQIDGSVAGAATLAAGSAGIAGDVEGDVIVAGGRISLDGGVGDDLRAVGGTVEVTGFVTDQATIAGGSVTIGPGSAIGGRTWLAGGDVEMAGQVGDDLRVAAGSVVISGRVAGDVDVAARSIRVEPGAVIDGDLIWRGKTPPQIAGEARILGEVRESGQGGHGQARGEAPAEADGSWAAGIAVAVAALILLWLAPQLVARAAGAFRAAPGRTLVLGGAAILLMPVVAVFLFATLLGWLLGLVVLAGYVFALLLSGLVGLLIAAHLLRDRLGGGQATGGWRRVALLLLMVVLLVLAWQVPLLGSLVGTLLLLTGFGALTALATGRAPSSS